MATYVDILPEDEQAIELARLVNNARTKGKVPDETFVEECNKLLEENKNLEFLEKLVTETKVIFAEDSEHVETFCMVMVALSKKLGAEKERKLLTQLVSAITANKEDKPMLRFRVLANTLNTSTSVDTRFDLVRTLIQFAKELRNIQALRLLSKEAENLAKDPKISIEQGRSLYQDIRNVLKSENLHQLAHEWNMKFLSSFTDKKDVPLDATMDAAIHALKVQNLYQYDSLFELPAFQALGDSSNSQHSKMFKLLKIFVGENLDSYKSFANENSEFLNSINLNKEDALRKIRLLTLASLGASQRDVSYAEVASALQIDEGEVEMWVITAIGEEILSAKMDQLKRLITISRCLHRVFGRAEWSKLSESVNLWKNNVKSILSTLRETKHQHASLLTPP